MVPEQEAVASSRGAHPHGQRREPRDSGSELAQHQSTIAARPRSPIPRLVCGHLVRSSAYQVITAAGLPRGHVHIREVRGDEIEVKPRKVCRELRLVCTIYQAERLGAVTVKTGEWAREGTLRLLYGAVPFTQVPTVHTSHGPRSWRKLAYTHAVLQSKQSRTFYSRSLHEQPYTARTPLATRSLSTLRRPRLLSFWVLYHDHSAFHLRTTTYSAPTLRIFS